METKVISIHRTAVKLYSKQINIDLPLTTETLYRLISPSLFYHLSIKWTKKKNCQHFIESIHESILLSGKQCTWMKVNDFPASPSNQYSLYKLMFVRSTVYQRIPVAPVSHILIIIHTVPSLNILFFHFQKPVIV